MTVLTLWVCVTSLLPPSRFVPPPLLKPQALAALGAPLAPPRPPPASEAPASSAGRQAAAELAAPLNPSAGDKAPAHSWPGFIDKLRELDRGERERVRVAHIGDSELVADGTSASLRRTLAKRFGMSALGFAAPMLPLPWYEREHWRHHQGQGMVKVWSFPYGKLESGRYGPGGVAFELSAGSRAHAELSHPVEGGCIVRFYYAQRPGGGDIALSADGELLHTIKSDGSNKLSHWSSKRPRCPKKLSLATAKAASLLYGWHIDYDRRGIEWSSLGVVAARLAHLHHYDEQHLSASLRALSPDLVVLTYGLNVAAQSKTPPPSYGPGAQRAFALIRRVLPEAACLVTGPYPFGSPDPNTGPRVGPARAVSNAQKKAAEAVGCSYLDRFHLAGGKQAAYRWGTARPKVLAGDFQHLTVEGSDRMGEAIAKLILDSVDGRDPSLAQRYFRLER